MSKKTNRVQRLNRQQRKQRKPKQPKGFLEVVLMPDPLEGFICVEFRLHLVTDRNTDLISNSNLDL